MELLDGSRLIAKEHRTGSEVDHPVAVHQAGFIQYLDSGVWHLAFYNDGRNVEAVSYNTIIQGTRTSAVMANECDWNGVQWHVWTLIFLNSCACTGRVWGGCKKVNSNYSQARHLQTLWHLGGKSIFEWMEACMEDHTQH